MRKSYVRQERESASSPGPNGAKGRAKRRTKGRDKCRTKGRAESPETSTTTTHAQSLTPTPSPESLTVSTQNVSSGKPRNHCREEIKFSDVLFEAFQNCPRLCAIKTICASKICYPIFPSSLL